MGRAWSTRVNRRLVVPLAFAMVSAACSSAPPLAAPVATVPIVATAVPTTALPTPPPTPTPLPTPTPTPEPLISTDLLRRSIDENFEVLDELGVEYSFAVFAEGTGYIERRNADTRLIPASNQKLVTAVGALELLRDDFRFVTEVRVDTESNVYVVGGGDPTLTSEHIVGFAEELVEQLALEIDTSGGDATEIDTSEEAADDEADEEPEVLIPLGDLVMDPSYFPPTRTGPGWLERYIPMDAGPMSGLMIDDNQHRGDDQYLADPDLGNVQLIAELFAEAGLDITGDVRVGAADLDAPLLVRRVSPALPTLIDTILGRSDNEIANALLRQIGLELGEEGEIPVGQALVFQRVGELGVELGPPVGDGAGLSRDNRLSAMDLVELLRVANEQPWWPIINDGLSGAGADGTLGARLETDTTRGNVRAKTGTLEDARALSGVLTTIDGAQAFFSLIINGEQADEAVDAMDQIIIAYASA